MGHGEVLQQADTGIAKSEYLPYEITQEALEDGEHSAGVPETMKMIAPCVWALLWAACIPARSEEPKTVLQSDLVFAKAGDEEVKLDFARPAGDGPFPLVVCIHGGAWHHGDKKDVCGWLEVLPKHGFAAAAVNYRLAPKHKFPAQIEDVKCAVRYLRSRAGELKIDPKRFAALGESAGGHLALLAGLLEAKDGMEGGGPNAEQSSRVQAVVNFYGPADLTADTPWTEIKRAQANAVFGTLDQKSETAARASPVTYINAGDPPVLTCHGTLDPVVPVEQARRLHSALKKAGVSERLEVIEGAAHGWKGKEWERTTVLALEFLAKQLAR